MHARRGKLSRGASPLPRGHPRACDEGRWSRQKSGARFMLDPDSLVKTGHWQVSIRYRRNRRVAGSPSGWYTHAIMILPLG